MKNTIPKQKTYPAPKGYYKVDVVGGCDWKGHDSLRMGISLGGKNHEGERFTALIEWAANRFETINILIADSLQRHNIMFSEGLTEEDALAHALKAGSDWVARNSACLRQIKNLRIYRLADLKDNSGFEQVHERLRALYDEDATFKRLVDSDILNLWNRKVKKGDFSAESSFEQFFKYSKDYLLEELAFFDRFYWLCPGVEAYPGKFLQILTSPDRFLIKGLPDSLLHYPLVEVDFVKNRAFQQQEPDQVEKRVITQNNEPRTNSEAVA